MTIPEQAGCIFATAKPILAAHAHIVLLNHPPVPPIAIAQVEAGPRGAVIA